MPNEFIQNEQEGKKTICSTLRSSRFASADFSKLRRAPKPNWQFLISLVKCTFPSCNFLLIFLSFRFASTKMLRFNINVYRCCTIEMCTTARRNVVFMADQPNNDANERTIGETKTKKSEMATREKEKFEMSEKKPTTAFKVDRMEYLSAPAHCCCDRFPSSFTGNLWIQWTITRYWSTDFSYALFPDQIEHKSIPKKRIFFKIGNTRRKQNEREKQSRVLNCCRSGY